MRNAKEQLLVTVYPYTRDFAPFCDRELSYGGHAIVIHKLVSAKGTGVDGRDAGYVDNRDGLGYVVESDFVSALESCTALLLVPGGYDDTVRDKLMDRAEQAIHMGKHILCGVPLEPEQENLLRSRCAESGLEFFYLLKKPAIPNEGKIRRMYRPNASVVFVGEVLEGTNGVDVALALLYHFKGKGYRASAILSSDIARLCGAYSHAELAPESLAEDQKIEAMNHIIRQIDTKEVPDVIIVQLPGGTLALNDIATNQFGVHAYMWSQAVASDCFVLCAPFHVFEEKSYADLSKFFFFRYGARLNCVHLSNVVLDLSNMHTYFDVQVGYVPMQEVLDHLQEHGKESDIPIYSLQKEDRDRLCAYVEDSLSALGDARAL